MPPGEAGALVGFGVGSHVGVLEDRAKERVKAQGNKARPQSVTIYGPDGDAINVVEVSKESEVKDVTDEKEGGKRPPPDGVDLTE